MSQVERKTLQSTATTASAAWRYPLAALTAIGKARTQGVAWCGVRNGNHAGPASLYAHMVQEAGMIGLYLAVGSANHLSPWGGLELLLSTNPIDIAAFDDPETFCRSVDALARDIAAAGACPAWTASGFRVSRAA